MQVAALVSAMGVMHHKHRGQSIVEILVVTGIIMIALSFLVPGAFMLVKAVHALKP